MDPRLEQAFARFDALNAEDPRSDVSESGPGPKELVYGQRMSTSLHRFAPQASVAVQLAARSQHLCRWRIARDQHPMTREGYHAWRRQLGSMHARLAVEVLQQVGYDQPLRDRVANLIQKKRLKQDPEAQLLQDVVCLVFLEHHLEDFAAKHARPKVIDILRKTWRKMSQEGQAAALALSLSQEVEELINDALAEKGDSPISRREK